MFPLQIRVVDKIDLSVKWDDGSESVIKLNKLRRFCPCATCLSELEKQSKTYIPIFSLDQVSVKEINTVGNYGLMITWQDGHKTGIYEFPFIRMLAGN
ncbi:MAG: DUF971 domain-containing protein [Ignavibacteriaceae bacterium]|jgi:DUF971 family protein|nr:DUF971 domain-containing protein [Ignavibacteriaceae bacterium]